MKQIAYGLVLVAWTAVGCSPTMTFFQEGEKPPKVELKPAPPPPAVTPDSVTEKNAADKAKALREELEHDLNARPTGDAEP